MRISVRVRLVLAGVLSILFAGAVSTAEAKPLTITKFSLQTTRPVEELGTREALEKAKLTGEPAQFTHDSFGFTNEPYSFTQAGGHPAALTYVGEFESEEIGGNGPTPTRDPKDIATALPPGLLGNPTAAPTCPLKRALNGLGEGDPCPADTQIGVVVLHILHGQGQVGPIINVTPEAGQSAEFALETPADLNFLLTAHVVRTPEGYGIVVEDNGIPNVELSRAELTFWGVPAAEVNDPERGLFCQRESGALSVWVCALPGIGNPSHGGGGEGDGEAEVPFLTMGTDCAAGPEQASMKADSWEEPGHVGLGGVYEGYVEERVTMPGVTGCNLLQFDPGIETTPDTFLADAPVGLGVNVTVPQVEEPSRLATPQLRNAVVTLPLGMSISPGIVDGIRACNESGPKGINFTGPESEEIGLNGEPQLAAGHCPDASIVGTAKAITPLLHEPVEGHVYLARPGCGGAGQAPCSERDALDGNLYKLYLELGGKGPLADTGVNLKFPGETEANPATGQLTTRFEGIAVGNPPRFEGNPQLPFSKLEVHLNGGPRAAIANPPVCGPAVTTADFTPWASPGLTPEGVFMAGPADATPSSFFDVNGCANPPGLSPGFVAGTVIPNAGKFSAFTLNIARGDREQYVKGVQVHTPPGLLGMLSSVQLCGESEADSGTCSEASKIGTTRVATGAGSHPFEVEGKVYLTGPHDGAPFGLSIVTNAVAGPFNLGLVIVRARIDVNPENSTLTVTTDETGPYALPQILDGVPLRLQRITVDIDRPGFMFNPTNCGAPGQPGIQRVTARISGSENAVANVQSQFTVGGCQSLAFKPSFTVSTSGHTSKADGASLDAQVSYPAGSVGAEANIASVKVELPEQLPSRLTTLQKACTAEQFETNPAGCPAASVVGIVRASTPLLPVGLEGPVYFVSHGGEAFPSLIVVLQGDGVRVDLTGSTFISKAGITSSTFKTVPDVPVNTFELYLPEGPYSALAANGNLCSLTQTVTSKHKITRKVHGRTVHKTVTARTTKPASLTMPTEMVAQNGDVLEQDTKIAVTGCTTSTAKAKTKPKRTRARKADRAGNRRTGK
jgi:hypothetical protein